MLQDPDGVNSLTERIIGCALAVHRAFGAGLLASVYTACLVLELQAAGLQVETERKVSLRYRGQPVGGFKIDLIVEGKVVLEVKAVEQLAPVHGAQLLTYLKVTGCPVGLLINFNVPVLKNGIRRLLRPR